MSKTFMCHRVLSIFLLFVILLSLVSTSVFAVEETGESEVASGASENKEEETSEETGGKKQEPVAGQTQSSNIPKEARAFDPRASEVLNLYAEKYGWDKDKMLTREWTENLGGRNYTVQREVGYQIDFLEDNMETTELYLDEQFGSTSESGANKMIEAANKEVGTSEEPKGSNKIKYNEWFYGEDADFTDKPWDAVFVAWVADQNGFLGDNGIFKKTASAKEQYDYLTGEKGFKAYDVRSTKWLYTLDKESEEQESPSVYEVVPGDILFWKDQNGNITHIGIVVSSTDKKFSVIEGDVDDSVQKKNYSAETLKRLAAQYEKQQEEQEVDDGEAMVVTPKSSYDFDSSMMELLNGTVVHVEYPTIAGLGNGVGSLGTLENAKYIYKFFKQNYNCPDELIAGALGNWNLESGYLDPTSVEGIYNEAHTYGPRKQAAMANPSSYIRRIYSDGVYWPAYIGRDGQYWPGIGLGGFTGPKATDLMDYATSLGRNWYDLDVQLQYCVNDKSFKARDGTMQNRYNDLFVNPAKHTQFIGVSYSQAAYLFYAKFEMPGNSWGKFMNQHGRERLANTQKWYNEIKAGNLAF